MLPNCTLPVSAWLHRVRQLQSQDIKVMPVPDADMRFCLSQGYTVWCSLSTLAPGRHAMVLR